MERDGGGTDRATAAAAGASIRVALAMPVNLAPGDREIMGLARTYALAAPATDLLDDVLVDGRGELFGGDGILPQSYPPGHGAERRDAAALARAAARAAVAARPLSGEFLFVTDRWSANYYHWLCDALPRLELALRRREPRRLLLPAAVHGQAFVRESLAAYGEITVEALAPGAVVRAERLEVPRHVAPYQFQHPELTRLVAQRLRRHFGATEIAPARAIHVTRRLARMRHLANEAELGGVLARHGFKTVALERSSFGEQVRMMARTRMLAGVHGAGLANMLFMAPGGAVLELRQLAGPPNAFVALAQTCGLGHFYLACRPLDPAVHPHAADLVAEPRRLEAVLSDMSAWTKGKGSGA